MKKDVLFIQGAGEGAHKADEKLVASLRQALSQEYEIHYPKMPDEENSPYEKWKERIEKELNAMSDPGILVGHSVGGSILAKYLSETDTRKSIAGVFLIASPFWGGDGWKYEGYEKLELPGALPSKLPSDASIFLYHSPDDETVPFDHLALYAKSIPQAAVRETKGGHQLNNDLSLVAEDIKALDR